MSLRRHAKTFIDPGQGKRIEEESRIKEQAQKSAPWKLKLGVEFLLSSKGLEPWNLPIDLWSRQNFVVWKTEQRGKDTTKVPYDLNGHRIDVTVLKRFYPLEDVLNAFAPGNDDDYGWSTEAPYDGLGLVIKPESGEVAIDLDGCRNRHTGKIEDWAIDIINRLKSYAEVSPSGTGLRAFVKATLPGGQNRITKLKRVQTCGDKKPGIELYVDKKYVSLTGNRLMDYPAHISEAQEAIDWILEKYFRPIELISASVGVSHFADDDELEDKILQSVQGDKYRRLRDGNDSGYMLDTSAGDFAFLCILAFWTKDADQIERVARKSKRVRTKWDERRGSITLLEYNIRKALATVKDGYNPHFGKEDHDDVTDGDTGKSHADAQPKDAQPKCVVKKVSQLLQTSFEEVRFTVDGILPEGLGLLGGKPKLGKTWCAQDIAMSVAEGEPCLGGRRTSQGSVLYLALEDNDRRFKKRIEKLRAGRALALEKFEYATEWPRGVQAADEIERWLKDHPDARLVVIDTLAKIRPPSNGRKDAYTEDYEVTVPLKRLCDQYRITILLIHHLRKQGADDPFDMISGTTGLTGGVDGMIVLQRQRGTGQAVMAVTGRDIEQEAEYGIEFDSATCKWSIIGDAATVRMSEERRQIIDLIKKAPDGLTAKDISELLEIKSDTVRKRLQRMYNEGELSKKNRKYVLPVSSVSVVSSVPVVPKP